jgi:YD repeat-containing protein
VGQYATVTSYANLAGTQLVSTATYTFDNAYQLVGLTYTKGATTLASYAYTYNAAGNRVTANGDTYTTGSGNKLTSDGDYAYTYDAEGNRTAKFIDADADGVLDAGDTGR